MKFPLTVQGIQHTVAKYINIMGVMMPLIITIGHTVEYFVQPKPTFSPIYTYMRNQGSNSIAVDTLANFIDIFKSFCVNLC